MKGYPIGIDLGTAYTRVAFFNGDQMNIIKDDYGNDAMPSYVAFTDSGVLVGEAARKQALENPTNTIFDVIHLIGRRSSDPSVQNNISLWPFKVSASPDDKLLVEVNWKSKLWHFTPVEICSLILIQMKKNAEKHLGATIADAVITVPVHYNYEQQQAIRQAGMIASLNFMQIICAPAATALFYGIERKHDKSSRKFVNKALKYFNKEPEEYNMIIIDVGAGTTDVSLVTITEDMCKVRATAGNIHLGELNFNNTMVYYFINWIKGRRCLDISKNAEAVSKLRAECDRAKVLLSSATGTVPMMISIGPQYNNVVIELSINVEKFNQLNNELFSMCQATIDACLRDADMGANMVHDIILAGGSTRIPMLQSYIRAYFGGKMLNINKNLETATACGAAYQSFFCSVTVNKNYLHLRLLDFTSFYLGIQFPQEKVTVHVPKNTIIPSLSSYYNKTTMPLAKDYEGEPNIPCDFNIGFEIQENGILMITAEEISSGMKKYIIINDNSIEDSRMRVWQALHYKESEVKDKPEEYAIGIDFGTTNSCVAVWQQDCVKIIEDKYGNRLTCSTVAFTDTGRLIGDAIHKEQVRTIPENTIPNIKRLISKCCNQSSVMNSRSMVSVRYKNENKVFAPEEIAAMILSKMKEIAEAHLGSKVTKAVVSVPACFNDSQRQAIMDAGVIAGLNVLELLNEPSAAAIAYFLQKVSAQSSSEKTLLIFDLGGGNLDVSILTINEGTIRVQAVVGDTELGGEDFDNNMVSHFVKKFMEEKERDISNKPGSLTKLRAACEKAKRVLSTNAQAVVEIDALDEGVEFSSVITRVDFEEFNRSLFDRSIDCVERCLKDAKMDRSSIDEVVLVGGSTRIPKMQQLLHEFFHEKELCKSMNADEAVVYGAAVRAAILSGNEDCEKFNISQLQDVTSLPFWLGSTDGAIMHVLIPKNTPIPAKKELLYTTCSDNLSSFSMEVLQYGLASSTVFNISGIVPKPRLNSNIILIFEVDNSGILNLTAKDASTGENYEKIVISKENVCLTEEEIEKMKEAADDYRKHDEENKERAAALNSLENFAYKMKAIARDQSVSESDKKLLVKAAEKAILWLETSDDAGIDGINKWKNKLETITSKVIT